MTAPTLLPPEFGGLEPVAQQSFSGRMAWDTAVGNFKAVVFADDGPVMKRFKISGVRTIASLVGNEQIGRSRTRRSWTAGACRAKPGSAPA